MRSSLFLLCFFFLYIWSITVVYQLDATRSTQPTELSQRKDQQDKVSTRVTVSTNPKNMEDHIRGLSHAGSLTLPQSTCESQSSHLNNQPHGHPIYFH